MVPAAPPSGSAHHGSLRRRGSRGQRGDALADAPARRRVGDLDRVREGRPGRLTKRRGGTAGVRGAQDGVEKVGSQSLSQASAQRGGEKTPPPEQPERGGE